MRTPRVAVSAVSAVVAVLLLLGAGTGARAQSNVPGKEYAKKLFEEGVDLEKKSDYTGALAKFREASQITVTSGIRFHEALCLEMTGKLAAAADAYESALKLARDQNKPDVEKAVQARFEPLRPRVPQLSLHLASGAPNSPSAKDVDVQLDGASIAPLLLDGRPFRVDPGDHAITARSTGRPGFARTVTAKESSTTNVEIVFDPPFSPSTSSPPGAAPSKGEPREPGGGREDTARGSLTEPPAESTRPSRVVPIAATVGAGVFLVTGITTFLLAGSAQSDGQAACSVQTTTTCTDDADKSKVRTLDTIALGGFIGAAALGAIAIVTWTSSGSNKAAARAELFAAPGGAGLRGAF